MIFFRCDSSAVIGTGHVIRCLALAHQLKDKGHRCAFICLNSPGNIGQIIKDNGFELHFFSDTNSTTDFLRSVPLADPKNWLIVDQYEIDQEWESQFKSRFTVVVVDDLANRQHECLFLIDQNYTLKPATKYSALVPTDCVTLVGPQFSLLRKDFNLAHKTMLPILKRDKAVISFFGGADPTNETMKYINALERNNFPFKAHLVVANSQIAAQEIKKYASTLKNTNLQIHFSPADMPSLLLSGQLFFGSGGTITWERMFLGLPGVIVSIADNQVEIAKDLHASKEQIYLGHIDQIDYDSAINQLVDLLKNESWLQSTSEMNMRLAHPISDIILDAIFSSAAGFSVTYANMSDAKFLFDLRNDPAVRKMFFNTEEIQWDHHIIWLKERFKSPGFRIYIGYINGEKFGQFRINPDGDTSVGISEKFRRQGLAAPLIEKASKTYIAEFPQTSELIAVIKEDNRSSVKSFLKAGYQEKMTKDGNIYLSFIGRNS